MVFIDSNSRVLGIGQAMPHFELPVAGGGTVSSNRGDPVLVVVFTCNHCPYAQAYEDRLIALAKEFGSRGAQLILISSNDATGYPDDGFEKMADRAREKAFPFPYAWDDTQETAKAFGALCTPHCFVFGSARKLEYKGRIDDNWKDASAAKKHELRDAVSALLDGSVPSVREANAIGCSIKWKPGNAPQF